MAGFGIGNLKPSVVQAIDIIDERSVEIISTKTVHQNLNAVGVMDEIVVALFIENEAILHPGAAAIFDINAQVFAGIFRLLKHLAHVVGRALRNAHDCLR